MFAHQPKARYINQVADDFALPIIWKMLYLNVASEGAFAIMA
jgi:hypothetical protein